MPVFEIVLPQLKRDTALMRELEEDVVPTLRPVFRGAGILNGLRGFLTSDDGRDARGECREIVVLEWPAVETFQNFISSAPFREILRPALEKFGEGPAVLKLYDYVDVPANKEKSSVFGHKGTVVELFVIKPKPESEVESVLEKLKDVRVSLGTERVIVGRSLNVQPPEIAVVSAWGSESDLEAAKDLTSRKELLADLATVADVTALVAPVDVI